MQRNNHLDAIVVGAGIAGLYAIYRLRELGLSFQAFDAAPDVFRANQYFTTLREVMRNARVYITPEHNFLLDFENKDKDFGQDVFRNFTTGDGIE